LHGLLPIGPCDGYLHGGAGMDLEELGETDQAA